jgi:DNA-binding MarR family transcriptional regulator
LDVIEMAAVTMVRNFELMRRRSDVYIELDRSEYLLLRTLDQLGPLDIYSLATALGLDPSTAGRQVSVMHGKGLVKRTPAATDRRRSIISPTAKGLRQMVVTRTRNRDFLKGLLDGWASDDVSTLSRMFTRFNDAVADLYLSGGQRDETL